MDFNNYLGEPLETTGDPGIDYFIDFISKTLAKQFSVDSILEDLAQIPGDILDKIKDFSSTLLSGMGFTPGTDPISQLVNVLSGNNSKIQEQINQIAELQDKTQQLLGIIGYGNYYCNTTSGTGNWERLYWPSQIGPSVGVTKDPSGQHITLNSKGLWRVDSHITFSWGVIATAVESEIRVYSPTGALFAVVTNQDNNSSTQSVDCFLPVVTPAAGYRVEVWGKCGPARQIIGGYGKSTLSILKQSNETS